MFRTGMVWIVETRSDVCQVVYARGGVGDVLFFFVVAMKLSVCDGEVVVLLWIRSCLIYRVGVDDAACWQDALC